MVDHVVISGQALNAVSTPDTDLDDPSADFELIVCCQPNDWTPTTWMPLITKHNGTGDLGYLWQLRTQTGGTHYMKLEVYDSTNTRVVNQDNINVALSPPSAAHRWFRVVFDADNGASQHVVSWYYSDDPIATAIGSITWTAWSVDTVSGAITTSPDTTAATMLMGTTFASEQAQAVGKLYCASIRYGGTEVADPDFRDGDQTSDGGATFVDTYGNIWTLQSASLWTGSLVWADNRLTNAGRLGPYLYNGSWYLALPQAGHTVMWKASSPTSDSITGQGWSVVTATTAFGVNGEYIDGARFGTKILLIESSGDTAVSVEFNLITETFGIEVGVGQLGPLNTTWEPIAYPVGYNDPNVPRDEWRITHSENIGSGDDFGSTSYLPLGSLSWGQAITDGLVQIASVDVHSIGFVVFPEGGDVTTLFFCHLYYRSDQPQRIYMDSWSNPAGVWGFVGTAFASLGYNLPTPPRIGQFGIGQLGGGVPLFLIGNAPSGGTGAAVTFVFQDGDGTPDFNQVYQYALANVSQHTLSIGKVTISSTPYMAYVWRDANGDIMYRYKVINDGTTWEITATQAYDLTTGHSDGILIGEDSGDGVLRLLFSETAGGAVRYLEVNLVGGGTALLRIHNDTLNIGFDFETLVKVVNESASLTELESTLRALLRAVIEQTSVTEMAQTILGLVRTANESLSLSESIIRARGRRYVHSESLSISESIEFYRALVRAVEESVSLLESDAHIRGLLRIHFDTLTATEVVTPVRFLLRAVNEGLSLSESILALRGLVRAVNETLALSEVDSYLRGRLRLISESLSIAETDAHLRGLFRLVNESASVSETDFSIRGIFRLVSESLTVTDTHLRFRGLFKVQDEALNLTETDLALRGLLALVAESLSVTETDDYLRGLVRSVNETITTTETPLTLRSLIRAVSETLNLTDTDIRVRALIRTQLDTIALSETDIAARGLIRSFSESIDISESDLTALSRALLRIVNETLNIGTLSAELLKIIDEAMGISEATQGVVGRLRIIVESISTTEDVLRFRALIRAISNVLELAETPLTARALTRIELETVAVSELAIRVRALVRSVSETLDVDETTATLLGLVRLISETESLSEDTLAIVTLIAEEIVKVVAESLTVTEVDDWFRGLFRVVDETITLDETVVTLRALVRTESDTLSLEETAARLRAIVRTFSESTQISEQVAVLRGLVRSVDETANISEADIRVLVTIAEEILKIVDESMSLVESDTWYRGIVRTLSETVTATEAVLMFRALARIQDETLEASETAARFRALVRTLNESESITEQALRVRALVRIASELANISDTQIPALGLLRIRAEILSIAEAPFPIRGFFKIVSETLAVTESSLSFIAEAFTGVLRKARSYISSVRGLSDASRDYQDSTRTGEGERDYTGAGRDLD